MANGDLLGYRLDQYHLQRVLGRGLHATVYLARDTERNETCAVKMLNEQHRRNTEMVSQFIAGGALGGRLRHPNIVPVYRVGNAGGCYYLAMAYLPGGTLEARLKRGPMPLKEALPVLRQVASALDFAHASNVLHLDVKPSNILFDASGRRAYLSDFGNAVIGQSRVRRGERSGTVHYMAPEQCQDGATLSAQADIYALAVVAYQALTGRVPFDAEEPMAIMYKVVHEEPPLPRALNRRVTERAESVLLKALSKRPENRFATAQALVQALDEPKREKKPIAGARRWPGFLLALALLAAAGYGAWWYYSAQILPHSTVTVTRVVYVTMTPPPVPTGPVPATSTTAPPEQAGSQQVAQTLSADVAAATLAPASPVAQPSPALAKAACPHPAVADITVPRNGEVLRGPVVIRGTAAGPRFVRYELKYKRAGEMGPAHQYAGKSWPQSVTDGYLATFNTEGDSFPPGEYEVYLVVVDETGNYKECSVKVTLQ